MTTTIVHLIGSLNRGGAETVALDLCRAIPPEQARQVFYCLSGVRGSLASEFEELGATVRPLPMANLFTFPRRLVRELWAERPDVVVSHVSVASGFLLAAAALLKVPVRIARVHSHGDGRGQGAARRTYRTIARVTMVLASTHILAVSQPSLEFGVGRLGWLARFRKVDCRVVPNGVDTQRFSPPDHRPSNLNASKTVLYVGRAAPEKNRGLLVPIFHSLSELRPSCWSIVGPGGVGDLGPIPSAGFEVLGERDDVAALMRDSDVLLLTSLREGLPGVVLESLATGTPVVLTDLPGMPALARAVSGISLVGLNASPNEWAKVIAQALSLSTGERDRIRLSFESSGFTLVESVKVWSGLWRLDR